VCLEFVGFRLSKALNLRFDTEGFAFWQDVTHDNLSRIGFYVLIWLGEVVGAGLGTI
jgi:hypothetical protein